MLDERDSSIPQFASIPQYTSKISRVAVLGVSVKTARLGWLSRTLQN